MGPVGSGDVDLRMLVEMGPSVPSGSMAVSKERRKGVSTPLTGSPRAAVRSFRNASCRLRLAALRALPWAMA